MYQLLPQKIPRIEEKSGLHHHLDGSNTASSAQDVIRYLDAVHQTLGPVTVLTAKIAIVRSTLFHELSHSTGHPCRLNRIDPRELAPFGSRDYSQEELVAEMGAAFLCGHCQIEDRTIDNSAACIAGWLRK